MKNKKLDWLALTLELPLAALSFIFYKIMKFIIGNIYTLYLLLNKNKTSQWRVLNTENLNNPLSLPVLMTKAPRWNTHAIIGTLGPFTVKESIDIDLESANNSTKSWIAVVYSFPDYETVTSVESNKIDITDNWAKINLKTGKYSVGLRYYNCTEKVILPAIKVDDNIFVNCENIPANINQFYSTLIKAKNWFYLGLHYYIFTILRLRKWLPESFVKQEFLPVGATDTEFFYSYLLRGQILEIHITPDLVKNYDIYLTIYDRSSLPVEWAQIREEKYQSNPIMNNGYYLIRMRPKYTSLEECLRNFPVASQVVEQDSHIQTMKLFTNDTVENGY